jgi:hypothetical protein
MREGWTVKVDTEEIGYESGDWVNLADDGH